MPRDDGTPLIKPDELTMKLLCWNCNGALRHKLEPVLAAEADIMIIAESEKDINCKEFNEQLWTGDKSFKGLSLISRHDSHLEADSIYSPAFRHILPGFLSCGQQKLRLWGVWATKTGNDSYNSYVVEAAKAFEYYSSVLGEDCLIGGDFNSSQRWLKHFKRSHNHARLLEILAAHGLGSVYHSLKKEEQGYESEPTFYRSRDRNKPYHIDYIFAGHSLLNRITHFEIGPADLWGRYSDHLPLLMEWK